MRKKELKEKFPQNYNFSFALANTFADLHRFKEAFVIAREIENGIHAGKPPFSPLFPCFLPPKVLKYNIVFLCSIMRVNLTQHKKSGRWK